MQIFMIGTATALVLSIIVMLLGVILIDSNK